MAEELNEFQENANFDETKLMALSNVSARLRRMLLLDSDMEVVVVENELKRVPRQMEKVKEGQVMNNAGGFVFPVSDETQVRRFLIIGSDQGTYHQTSEKITMDNAQRIIKIIEQGNGHMVLRELALINAENRNPKMNAMLFTLAICSRVSTHDTTKNNECPLLHTYSKYIGELHAAALRLIPDVCRTPTHLFEFIDYCQTIAESTKAGGSKSSTGWGRSLRVAISNWYKSKTPEKLAMLLTKYPQREGWSHRDLFRLAHPNLMQDGESHTSRVDRLEREQLFRFAVKGDLVKRKRKVTMEEKAKIEETWDKKALKVPYTEDQLIKEEQSSALDLVEAYLKLKNEQNEELIVEAIKKHGLVREHLPTTSLNSKLIWETLFDVHMPMTAMIRNLAKMTVVGALDEQRVETIVKRLTDQEELRRSRIHPLNLLTARAVYAQGRGDKGSLKWEPNRKICDALEAGFYKAFVNSPPTGKRYCLALDVSGSMTSRVSSSPLSCREAATGMSLINLHNEAEVKCVAFCDKLTELPFTKDWTIAQVNDYVNRLSFGSTDCGLPMTWATENNLKFDVFIIYTDNDTWAGEIHPFEAIKKYREASGIHDAKVIVMAMQAYDYSIADPSDAGMLDITGFDSAVPQIVHEFVTGKI
uniref:TROVE domain-containing protein n=1 Tax=Caenorhabditis tropicalis TaxID=1561998 RepID=A0A1I7T5U7_9PELO